MPILEDFGVDLGAFVYHGLAVHQDDRILLAGGNKIPFLGRWKFPWFPYPGGNGNSIISSAVTTLKEKTGIEALVEGFVGVYETPWGKDASLILLLFQGRYQSGELSFNRDDFSALRWFNEEEFSHLSISELYTPAMRKVFSDVLSRKIMPLDSIHLIDLLKGTLLK